jgi:hypothetical protein
LKKVEVVSRFIKKSKDISAILELFWIFSELFFIGKVIDRVYGSLDHDWLSVHGGLVTLGHHDHSMAQDVVVIARRERERGRQSSHQWCHATWRWLLRWPHDGAQQRQSVVLRWGDGSRREEERLEPGGCGG